MQQGKALRLGRWSVRRSASELVPERTGLQIDYLRSDGRNISSFPVPSERIYHLLWPYIMWRAVGAIRELDRSYG